MYITAFVLTAAMSMNMLRVHLREENYSFSEVNHTNARVYMPVN